VLNSAPSIPYFDVFYNGNTKLPQYAKCLRIVQKTNAHAIALVDVVYVGQLLKNVQQNSWQYLPEHTPVTINYGQRPHYVAQFVGYVGSYKLMRSGADPGYNNLTTTTVQYTIIGTSQVMQSTHNQAWKNISPSSIAGAIATRNGMRSIIHAYNAAIPYRLQNSSDFKFLNQLAHEIGFKFYVDNTDLYFVNPQLILDKQNIRNVPTFWSYNRPGIYDTVRDFKPVVGTITPDGGISANRNVIGLNPLTKQITQSQILANLTASATNPSAIAPVITQYYNELPAESYFEAVQKTQGDVNRNLYWNTATANLWGDARVKPNTLINLVGSALPDNELGAWIVEEVCHYIEMPSPAGSKVTATYYMDLVLGRDQVYTTINDSLSETSSVNQPVPATLIGGVWRSSNLGANIYAT
jgi:hypothetical protein